MWDILVLNVPHLYFLHIVCSIPQGQYVGGICDAKDYSTFGKIALHFLVAYSFKQTSIIYNEITVIHSVLHFSLFTVNSQLTKSPPSSQGLHSVYGVFVQFNKVYVQFCRVFVHFTSSTHSLQGLHLVYKVNFSTFPLLGHFSLRSLLTSRSLLGQKSFTQSTTNCSKDPVSIPSLLKNIQHQQVTLFKLSICRINYLKYKFIYVRVIVEQVKLLHKFTKNFNINLQKNLT